MKARVLPLANVPAVALIFALAACGGPQTRPGGDQDGPPRSRQSNYRNLPEPVPRAEPRAKYGNHSPYTVNGNTYHVLASSRGYHERGRASWYGRKFHGRRTSSGETFDMHQLSAAHRTLPLPSYVEVTNLDNGKRLTVRVNDRGPFHADRILDLSYAAAVKLGFADQGTARVEVRAIDVLQASVDPPPTTAPPATTTPHGDSIEPTWLQVGAFGEHDGALQLQRRLRRAGFDPVTIITTRLHNGDIHRVRLGPFRRETELRQQATRLVELGLDNPVRVSLECQPQGLSC